MASLDIVENMGCNGSKDESSSAIVETPSAASNTVKGDSPFVPVVLSPGTCESVYSFGNKLGSGAYSTVFLCKHKKNGTEHAVKKVTKANLQPYDHDALKDEVKLLKGCSHKNIICFNEFFEDSKFYYVVTEVIEGGELFDRICDKTVYTEAEARNLVIMLLKTLHYLHKRKIAHRDLKPENLLLRSKTDDTDIVLADFGFAQLTDGKSLQQVCGTPDYVAPEVLNNEKYDFSCDIWSAGVIVFILLGGYPPFQAKDENDRDALFAIIKKGKFRFHEKFWKEISPEAKSLVSDMLTVDVAKRPTADVLLKHNWLKLDKSQLDSITIDTANLKEFNAKRKLKAAGKAIVGLNRMKKATDAFASSKSSSIKGLAAAAVEKDKQDKADSAK
jgi:serine/threonine protein kinase